MYYVLVRGATAYFILVEKVFLFLLSIVKDCGKAKDNQQQKAVPTHLLAIPATSSRKLQHGSQQSPTSGQADGSHMIFLLMMSNSSPFNYLASPFSFLSNQGSLTWFLLMRLALDAAISLIHYWISAFPSSPSCTQGGRQGGTGLSSCPGPIWPIRTHARKNQGSLLQGSLPKGASILQSGTTPQADIGPELDVPDCSCTGSCISSLPLLLCKNRQEVLQTTLVSKASSKEASKGKKAKDAWVFYEVTGEGGDYYTNNGTDLESTCKNSLLSWQHSSRGRKAPAAECLSAVPYKAQQA